ncbi:MAG: hypothetical protein ABSG68_14455 [Thermoguttaceae bacterium]
MSQRITTPLAVISLAYSLLLLCSPRPLNGQPAELSQREIVRRAMHDRPGDPWPRGVGHVVLAVPGSQQPEKAYHEPGGSFSPCVRSFGVSIWVRDEAGRIKTTSDQIELTQVRQRFTWPHPHDPPAIATETPHYAAQWSYGGQGVWVLKLDATNNEVGRLEVAIRSVGPAGGPIKSLAWDGTRLAINDRWTATLAPPPKALCLGREGETNWKSASGEHRAWKGDQGWGYARIELAGPGARLTLRDLKAGQATPLKYATVRSTIELELPEQRFADCLHAQVAHLMMGLLDRRTPPGEPTNYPLAWQRDGAASITGLARAGQLETARELAKYFAENDFFGGFGSEGDAPGQALRTIEDVAVRVQDAEFDRWLWPHVARKVALIRKMRETDRPLRLPYCGPIVPAHRRRLDLDLVCDPARDGLIIGRMDWGRPVLYVNAVSYRGLLSAAALADRLKHAPEAAAWRAEAAAVQQAWLRAFRTAESNEPRTYISGLWPTGVAAPIRAAYAEKLQQQSVPGWQLPWTYFTAALAHQWLMLDRPEEAWKHLAWFWDHQTSPGLYTWWEGTGEENTFGLWEDVRGWVQPHHVTPHYWTAGEILALQADMLAYVDQSGPQPVLVVGGGVPAAWLEKTIRVGGLPTSVGLVDWTWSDGRLRVSLAGRPCRVRAGTAFGPAAKVEVQSRGP